MKSFKWTQAMVQEGWLSFLIYLATKKQAEFSANFAQSTEVCAQTDFYLLSAEFFLREHWLSQYQHFLFDTDTKCSIAVLDTETILMIVLKLSNVGGSAGVSDWMVGSS